MYFYGATNQNDPIPSLATTPHMGIYVSASGGDAFTAGGGSLLLIQGRDYQISNTYIIAYWKSSNGRLFAYRGRGTNQYTIQGLY